MFQFLIGRLKTGKLYNIFNEFINGEHKYKKTYADKTKQKRIAELKEIEKNMENTFQFLIGRLKTFALLFLVLLPLHVSIPDR